MIHLLYGSVNLTLIIRWHKSYLVCTSTRKYGKNDLNQFHSCSLRQSSIFLPLGKWSSKHSPVVLDVLDEPLRHVLQFSTTGMVCCNLSHLCASLYAVCTATGVEFLFPMPLANVKVDRVIYSTITPTDIRKMCRKSEK